MPRLLSRQQLIRRMRAALESGSFPRLQMLVIITLTGLTGFLTTAALLHEGWTVLWSRYLTAFGVAYGVFLLCLWIWLRMGGEGFEEVPDLLDGSSCLPEGNSLSDSSLLDGLDASDELGFLLLALALIAALLFASIWLFLDAPLLLAELAVDGLLSARLYRRLSGLEAQNWLTTALRLTAWRFAATAAVVCPLAALLQSRAPEAVTLGEVIQQLLH